VETAEKVYIPTIFKKDKLDQGNHSLITNLSDKPYILGICHSG